MENTEANDKKEFNNITSTLNLFKAKVARRLGR